MTPSVDLVSFFCGYGWAAERLFDDRARKFRPYRRLEGFYSTIEQENLGLPSIRERLFDDRARKFEPTVD